MSDPTTDQTTAGETHSGAFLWIATVSARSAVVGLVICSVASGVFHIPFWQVADVTLALILAWSAIASVFYLFLSFAKIIQGELRNALRHLLLVAGFLLQPFIFDAVLATWAAFFGEQLGGASFVHDGFLKFLYYFRGYVFEEAATAPIVSSVDTQTLIAVLPYITAAAVLFEAARRSWKMVGPLIEEVLDTLLEARRGRTVRALLGILLLALVAVFAAVTITDAQVCQTPQKTPWEEFVVWWNCSLR